MKMLKLRKYHAFMLVTGLLLQSMLSYAQNLSNKGKEFWVAYGHHQFMEPGQPNSQEMVLYLSAEQPANVTVRIWGTAWVRNYSIPANTVIATEYIPKAGFYDARLYSVPPSFGGTGGEGVFTNKAIQITSDVPIVAYAHIFGSASSGATMLMPVETWGYSYISLNSEQDYNDNCFSWMYVIANEDNTVIEVTPSVPSRNGRVPGVPFTETLMKGEVYQLIGASLGSGMGHELTGTKVKVLGNAAGTCAPVAVYSGSSRTYISCPGGFPGGGDNNMQQIFPSQAWGKQYLTAPTSTSNSASSFHTNIYKVLVKDPTTVVKRNGTVLTGLISNTYYQFQSNTADFIEADKPVLVAQFMSSTGGCPNTSGLGDPEMVYLSPVAQAIKQIGFYRNTRESIDVNYLTLIIPDSGLNSLLIDGLANAYTHTYPHPNRPGYTVVVKRWPAAQAQCLVQSDSAFTAVTYGLGSVESYGYNAGTLINNLNVIGNIHNTLDSTSTTNEFTCTNTPVELSVLIAYQPTKMVWKLSELGTVVTPNADVTDNAPVSAGTVMVDGVPYYKYTLPQTYIFNTVDTFDIPILSTHPSIENCNNTEEVKFSVIVKGKPQPVFSWEHTGCTLDPVLFTGDTASDNGYNIDRWKWEFPGPVLDSGQQVEKTFPAGTYNVALTGISKEGCVGDTTLPITIYDKPVADFTIAATPVCEGGSIAVTDNATFGGSAPIESWYWDFGNDTTVTDTTDAQQTAHYSTYNTYTIKHVVKVSDLCVSDTVSQAVTVYANPELGFTYPESCLEVNGLVQFNSTTTVPDGQAITDYAWNFGDANATPANPNTSDLADPTHAYTRFGTYDIQYSVTTENGCTKDTTVAATFNLKPQLDYPALTAVCENVTGLSVARASVTNGVGGTGIYKGPGTDATGSFNPAQAGPGTHTIKYVFTSTSGCMDSVSSTITVYPKPVAAFTATADVCLGELVTITDQSQVVSGSITTWKWSFGDGTTANNTNGNTFTRSYTAHNTYNVKLVAVSDNSCLSDTVTRAVTVHPLPVADFSLPASICMPQGSADFTNQSTVADNSALSWSWSFGDGSAGSTVASPSHVYAASGAYTVQLTATSAYGCTHDTSKVLSAFYDKPIASFLVEPDTLCQGTDNVFTDQSTAPNSSITEWTWDFGDGSSAGTRNPVKRYDAPGNYNVTLTVTNAVGCASDPFAEEVIVYLQPIIDAGPSFIVPEGTLVQFNPTANDSTELVFRWTPAGDFADPSILRPSLVAYRNETYTLTATGQGNCSATDALTVKVLRPVKVPNAFSPNGDGINDRWVIPNLADYPGATVDVYNRYGQRIYSSAGYGVSWDGAWNGQQLPLATYYYVIKLQNGFPPLTGYVTILR